MCIIIHKKAGIKLPRDTYEVCFDNNPEGAGICYVKDKVLVSRKGFFKFDELYNEAILPNEDLELVIHFRVASVGMVIDQSSCHPFISKCDRDGEDITFALVHNGTLIWKRHENHSDTSCFNHDFMVPTMQRDPWYFDSDLNRLIFERGVLDHGGRTNKMVIMKYNAKTDESSVIILNKEKGVMHADCWFSNVSYLPKPKFDPTVSLVAKHFGQQVDFDSANFYSHRYRQVKGKFLSWFEYNAIKDRGKIELVNSMPDLVEWNKLSANDRDERVEVFCGFDEAVQRLAIKKSFMASDKKDTDKQSKKVALKGVKRNNRKMKWLDDAERAAMLIIVGMYCKEASGIDFSGWSDAEKIDWMRCDFTLSEQGCADLTVPQLDRYIIAVYKQQGTEIAKDDSTIIQEMETIGYGY